MGTEIGVSSICEAKIVANPECEGLERSVYDLRPLRVNPFLVARAWQNLSPYGAQEYRCNRRREGPKIDAEFRKT